MNADHYSRLLIFALVILACLAAEYLRPRRRRKYAVMKRWPANFGVAALNSLMIYIALPLTALAAAVLAQRHEIGLFYATAAAHIPEALIWLICFLALDFSVYIQHVLFHKLGFLWPYHAMHHSDEDLDASSGIRFHPIEILISALYKGAVVIALGAPLGIVIAFEVILNAASIFTHSNLNIPPRLDKALRFIFITPDMHRIHHSVEYGEQNSNFGFCLSIWDRLCGTYTQNPQTPQESFPLGLREYQNGEYESLWNMLKQPFAMMRRRTHNKKGE